MFFRVKCLTQCLKRLKRLKRLNVFFQKHTYAERVYSIYIINYYYNNKVREALMFAPDRFCTFSEKLKRRLRRLRRSTIRLQILTEG